MNSKYYFILLTTFLLHLFLASLWMSSITPDNHREDTFILPTDLRDSIHSNTKDENSLQPESTDLSMQPHHTRFLSVGITFVWRDVGLDYLMQTLRSFIDPLTPEEKKEVVFVVASVDKDFLSAGRVGIYLKNAFPDDYGKTLIFYHVSPGIYPKKLIYDPCSLKRKYDDPILRVFWRSKQVLDSAYLINATAPLAKYYLHLEDDTPSIKSNWFTTVKRVINEMEMKKPNWFLLRFYGFPKRKEGAIFPIGMSYKNDYFGGMFMLVFPSERLPPFTRYLLSNYDEAPIDWLLGMYSIDNGLRTYNVNYNITLHLGSNHSTRGSLENYFNDYSNLVDWKQCEKLYKS